VVRLPRDWLGPREELVPFGPRAGTPDDDQRPTVSSETAASQLPEPPPAAEDFWGERSASIHDVLQAPADGAWAQDGVPDENPSSARRDGSLRIRMSRRTAAIAVAGLAIAGAAVFAFASDALRGSARPNPASGGSKANAAAVLGSGISRILALDLPHIVTSGGRTHRPDTVGNRPRTVRRSAHRAATPAKHAAARRQHAASTGLASRAVHYTPPTSPTSYHTTSSSPSSPASTERSSPVQPSHNSPSSRGTASQASSSHASARPTGESGALGPISSPNG
jgi:hypothetical protein